MNINSEHIHMQTIKHTHTHTYTHTYTHTHIHAYTNNKHANCETI